MVGHTLTIADLCGWGKIQTAAMWMKVRSTPEACNVRRWFEFCSQQAPVATALEQLAPKKVGKDAKVCPSMMWRSSVQQHSGDHGQLCGSTREPRDSLRYSVW